MATTPKVTVTLLEIGQKDKETTINEAFTKFDAAIGGRLVWLGKLASDPTPSAALVGSMYFNTTTNKTKLLIDATTWVQVG